MENPATVPWSVQLSAPDFAKLKQGFMPKQMDDKWACIVDEADDRGSILVHWQRTWPEVDQIILRVNTKSEGAEIVEITWDKCSGLNKVSEEEGKKLAKDLSQGLLG